MWTDRDLLLIILGILSLTILGTLDYVIEVSNPGEDVIDVTTVAVVAVLSYRVGKSSA